MNDNIHKTKKDYKFFINDNQKNQEIFNHKNNEITQTKYNLITFLPKGLLYQFFRLANIYFLIIMIIQVIPQISPLSGETAYAPLVFVLFISLIREGYEDFKRYLMDNQLNSEPALKYVDTNWIETKSGQLHLGDFVIVKEDNPFPADLIILDSNLKDGVAYIETGTLDGEKTLKNKGANKETAGIFNQDLSVEEDKRKWKANIVIKGDAYGDSPNSELYKFDGFVSLNYNDGNQKIDLSFPVDAKQMLLKGAILKNTKWIVGIVVYAGHNTKLILNSKTSTVKFSKLEKLMSRFLLGILLLQCILCIICAISNKFFYENYGKQAWYLPGPQIGPNTDSFLSYFTYMLLLNTMIPISLIISLEIIKLIQGGFISVDCDMYCFHRDKFVTANSISLNEELGQVDYIFSDKTGTLTCNKMCFKYCVIGDTCYEYNKLINEQEKSPDYEERKILRDQMNIQEVGPDYFQKFCFPGGKSSIFTTDSHSENRHTTLESNSNKALLDSISTDSGIINEYWKCLVNAHECGIEEKHGNLIYSGMSPDDIELLNAASEQGFKMVPGENGVRTVQIKEQIVKFDILNVIEFSSDRKRMSIIIKDGNNIKMFIKGADSEIIKRISNKYGNPNHLEISKQYVNFFSQKGYRTLLLGVKILEHETYKNFENELKEAGKDLSKKHEKTQKLYDELEQDFILLGSTIVEDKLQDQVPETIRDLRLAGIKIWMLTGDKFNTALNIGLSCNLVSSSLKVFKLKGEDGEKLDKLLNEYEELKKKQILENRKIPFAIIADFIALNSILPEAENSNKFFEIAKDAESVICCRVSPLQKSEVVRAMKDFNKECITLSIGDGGNDVSMILEAHIGIGIHGEEGMRAVQASDYSLGEFKALRKLLLFHGRTNYMRISEVVLYFFYKNFVFTIIHFYFSFLNLSSGQTIIDDWFITLFNLLFTALPLGLRACLDQDFTTTDGDIINKKLLPFLYKEFKIFPLFTIQTFFLSLTRGIVHGLFGFLVIYFTTLTTIIDVNGNTIDLWFFSVNLFSAILFSVSLRIICVTRYHTILNPIIILITSWTAYIIFLSFVNNSNIFNSVATMNVAFNSPKLWLNFLLIIGFAFMFDLFTYSTNTLFSPALYNKLRMFIQENGGLNNENNLPDEINQYLEIYQNAVLESRKLEDKIEEKAPNMKDLKKIDRVDDPNELIKNASVQEIKNKSFDGSKNGKDHSFEIKGNESSEKNNKLLIKK